jgi:TyrR family helix-turn-helix protein
VNHLLRKYNRTYRLKRRISPEALKALQSHPFPGNVRELKSILKTAVLMGERDVVDNVVISGLGIRVEKPPTPNSALPEHLRDEIAPKERGSLTDEINSVEKQILEEALVQFKTTRELARQLGISQPTVVRKLKKYALSSSV